MRRSDRRPERAGTGMRVELLYFDGCPNHEMLVPRLRDLLVEAGVGVPLELLRVESTEAAEAGRFLGSPSVRVNGVDVDPGAAERTDFGLKCRLYATAEGLRGAPPDEWIADALARGGARAGNR